MLGDISTPEAVERERRSVTMLPTGAHVYDREEALAILAALAAALARDNGPPSPLRTPQPS